MQYLFTSPQLLHRFWDNRCLTTRNLQYIFHTYFIYFNQHIFYFNNYLLDILQRIAMFIIFGSVMNTIQNLKLFN